MRSRETNRDRRNILLQNIESALITGASGGIGEAFARQLAALGKDLILVARREDRLQSLAGELGDAHGVQVQVIAADLARPSAAQALFAETEQRGLPVDLLINNAGFGKGGEFTEIPFEAQAEMVRLNVNTLMELTRLYLPSMRRRRRGGVINVASTAAFQPVPYLAVYGATKAFVLSFSEAVAQEVRADGVTVMALCPGPTATGFWAVAGLEGERPRHMPGPEVVAAQALRAFEQGRGYFIQEGRNKVMALAARFAPRRLVLTVAARMFRSE
ncbi:MAG TPA: SDR family oxidoreductase [Anaerolineae bacterium]|nr:SDR family oxidoreductase [Anaerolineae bacterium]